ncbi:alpha/beta hydrolase [Actinotalea sp. M2MS4P-6]|uniref:alpha/beta fold hydrolase n=1 Tax=Actinotalea sp. M2MS4P-6 TaxID=2983762 RepID=UPI0021E440B8|nr:alpha/beta hydrolase [Actinotalea sp. M2MS4P-6]MCV2394746.1 alpha/beta hydrolase [Actinotalea sp. M2MS4P-6]
MAARRRPGSAGTVTWNERTVQVGGLDVFVRTSTPPVPDATPIVHVHGFGISGASLLPTAERLTTIATNVVPDLPGHGRSERWDHAMGIPALAEALVELLGLLEMDRVVLVGNSMGCPVSLEVAHMAPELVERVVLTSPAGGLHNQPFRRAMRQMLQDIPREDARMARIALPDYARFGPVNTANLFAELTRFPTLERVLRTNVPTLAVIGTLDPLMPPPTRVMELARQAHPDLTVVIIEGAAHAVNFSHPGELTHVIRSWLEGREIRDDPDEPGLSRVVHLPRA